MSKFRSTESGSTFEAKLITVRWLSSHHCRETGQNVGQRKQCQRSIEVFIIPSASTLFTNLIHLLDLTNAYFVLKCTLLFLFLLFFRIVSFLVTSSFRMSGNANISMFFKAVLQNDYGKSDKEPGIKDGVDVYLFARMKVSPGWWQRRLFPTQGCLVKSCHVRCMAKI